jgi:hypothetical protein
VWGKKSAPKGVIFHENLQKTSLLGVSFQVGTREVVATAIAKKKQAKTKKRKRKKTTRFGLKLILTLCKFS